MNPYALPRRSLLTTGVTALLAAALVCVIAGVAGRDRSAAPVPIVPAPSGFANPPGMTDRLVMLDTADAFSNAVLQRAKVTTGVDHAPPRITLDDPRKTAFPREGSWLSTIIHLEFPFTELIPSWNADVPADCGVWFEVRAHDLSTSQWLPWVTIGSWGRVPSANHTTSFPGGRVDVDNLQLSHPADAFQIRANLLSYSLIADHVPSVRRIAAVYSGVARSGVSEGHAIRTPSRAGGIDNIVGEINLPVPFRTQKDAPAPLRSQICSPTSVSMVLDYWGVDHPTTENALAIYDADHDMFGNWNRAVQFAASLGLDAWITRFRSWDQVRAELTAGHPIIASIRFNKGEFPTSVLSQSDGHLIVIRGLTADGAHVIVNDPANRDRGNAALYKSSELAHAWFDHGGVAYIIRANPQPAQRPTTLTTTTRATTAPSQSSP